MSKAPLLFDNEPTEQERFLKQLAVEQAFSVKPNAGQTWEVKVGTDEQGKPVYRDVKIVAVANTTPESTEPPTVLYRNSRRELKTCLLKDWADDVTFFKVQT